MDWIKIDRVGEGGGGCLEIRFLVPGPWVACTKYPILTFYMEEFTSRKLSRVRSKLSHAEISFCLFLKT